MFGTFFQDWALQDRRRRLPFEGDPPCRLCGDAAEWYECYGGEHKRCKCGNWIPIDHDRWTSELGHCAACDEREVMRYLDA